MKSNKTETIAFKVSKEEKDLLNKIAEERDITVSQLIREYYRKELREYGEIDS